MDTDSPSKPQKYHEEDATSAVTADATIYQAKFRLTSICIALSLTVFISALSNTIIATAIPTITAAFDSYEDIGWYSSGELITSCAFILPYGAAYSLLSPKWTFLASLLIYLIGSAICGSAPTSIVLIVGRAVSGVGSAGILGGAFIILAKTTPLEKRSIFNGLVGATFSVASVCGPLIGGAFTSQVTWRWCFYFNLPTGAIPAAIIIFLLPSSIGEEDREEELKDLPWRRKINKFDPLGTVLILGVVITLLLALQFGGSEYGWRNYRAIVCFVIFGVLLLCWMAVQQHQGDAATVPFSIFKTRTVACAVPYTLLNGASFVIIVFYIPIWFQSTQGDGAETSGLKQLALVLSVSLSTVLSGVVIAKVGYYVVLLVSGTILTSVGAGLLYTLKVDSSLGESLGFQIIYGVGVGMGLNAATIAVQNVLPKAQVAKGTSAELFARQFGGALGSPIAQSVLSKALVQKLGPSVAAQVFQGGSAVGALEKLRSIYGAGTPQFSNALKGFNDAVTQTFMLALILSSLTLPFGILVQWKSVKSKDEMPEEASSETKDVASE